MAVISTIRPDGNSLQGSWTNEAAGSSLFGSIDEVTADDDTTYIEWLATGVVILPPPAEDPQDSGLGRVNLGTDSSIPDSHQVRDAGSWKNVDEFKVRRLSSLWTLPNVISVRDAGSWKTWVPLIVIHARLKRVVSSGGGTTKIRLGLYESSTAVKVDTYNTITSTTYVDHTLTVTAGEWMGRSVAGLQISFQSEVTPDDAGSTLGIRITQAYLEFQD